MTATSARESVLRRMLVGMSQEKLGEACGITFQQIQKYEKGMNRMGASRLHQIAAFFRSRSSSSTKEHLRDRTPVARLSIGVPGR